MYLFSSLNIYLFGKKMLDSFVQKQSKKKKQTKNNQPTNPKPLQIVNTCNNYNDVNLDV